MPSPVSNPWQDSHNALWNRHYYYLHSGNEEAELSRAKKLVHSISTKWHARFWTHLCLIPILLSSIFNMLSSHMLRHPSIKCCSWHTHFALIIAAITPCNKTLQNLVLPTISLYLSWPECVAARKALFQAVSWTWFQA